MSAAPSTVTVTRLQNDNNIHNVKQTLFEEKIEVRGVLIEATNAVQVASDSLYSGTTTTAREGIVETLWDNFPLLALQERNVTLQSITLGCLTQKQPGLAFLTHVCQLKLQGMTMSLFLSFCRDNANCHHQAWSHACSQSPTKRCCSRTRRKSAASAQQIGVGRYLHCQSVPGSCPAGCVYGRYRLHSLHAVFLA